MNPRKHIIVTDTLFEAFKKTRGKSHNSKMLYLLNATEKHDTAETISKQIIDNHVDDLLGKLDLIKEKIDNLHPH